MLVSHACKFIYLKTVKTAGTSVEVYFEPYCIDPAKRQGEMHQRDEEVSAYGIVGWRGSVRDGAPPAGTWYNHMPAARVRELLGAAVWEQYFRFCVVRNPFDKAVSQFWYHVHPHAREALRLADFSAVREAFSEWMKSGRMPVDREIYTIDGHPAVNHFVRYESLEGRGNST